MFDEDFDEDDLPIPVVSDSTPTAGDLLPIAERVALGVETGKHHNGAIVPFPPHLRGRAILDALTGDERKLHQRLVGREFKAAVYEYLDAEGRVIFAALRWDHPSEPKEVRPLRYCGKDRHGMDLFWFNLPKGTRPLMSADQLAARPDAPVLMVEGEKTAVAAAALFPDHVVVTWPSGVAGARYVDLSAVAGRSVVAWPDNDIPGRGAARVFVARALDAGAVSAALVDVPSELGAGWDLADAVPDSAGPLDLAKLLASARTVTAADAARYIANAERQSAKRRLLGHRPGYSNVSIEAASTALSVLDADMGGGAWHRAARCWYHAYGETGLAAFDAWSSRGAKYKDGEPAQMWEGYGREEGFVASPLAWLLRLAKRTAAEKQLNVEIDAEALVIAEIDALSADHAVVSRGGKTAVMREWYDPRFERYGLTYLKKADFVDKHVRKVALPGDDDKSGKSAPLGKLWFNTARRREYDGVMFLPGKSAGYRMLNLWRGFAVDPVDNPDGWSKFKDHIFHNIAGGEEMAFAYILNWMAYAVQHLDKPVRTTLVLTGAKGAGKSIFSVILGHLFGEHHFATAHASDVLGKFNAHLEYVLTLGLEEAVAPENRAQDSVFKDLINSDTLRLEEKFMGVWRVPNHLRIILTSNNEHVVRADGIDRRFAVFAVTHPDIAAPDARRRYFGELVEQMECGGYEAMLGELLARDVSGWNPEAIPETEALRQQKLLNLATDPVRSWLHERLTDGTQITFVENTASGVPVYRWSKTGNTTVVARHVLDDFVDYIGRNGMRSSERRFAMGLSRYMPGGFKSRVAKLPDGDGTSSAHRVYDFPSLEEARAAFAEKTGLGDWPEADPEEET